MFKKIYIEITNKCNLNCSFCSKNNRKIKEVSVEEFEYIVKKIDIIHICYHNNIKYYLLTS